MQPRKRVDDVGAKEGCTACERLLPKGEPKTRAISEINPPSHPTSSDEDEQMVEEGGRHATARHPSSGRRGSKKSLEKKTAKTIGLFERAIKRLRSLFQSSEGKQKERQGQKASAEGTTHAAAKERAKLIKRKRLHSQAVDHESESETETDSDSDTEAGSESETGTDSGSGTEADSGTEAELEFESRADSTDAPKLPKDDALPRFKGRQGRTKGHLPKKSGQEKAGTGDSNSEGEHTIEAVAREQDTPLGFLAQESYYPSFIPSEGCRALVDAIVANDATRLRQELARTTNETLDMLSVQIILHTAIRNNRRYALWQLTDHLMKHLTPPMIKGLECVLQSEGINSENAFAYWRDSTDSDEGRRAKLERLLGGLSEHALANFVPVWAASRYGSKALAIVLPKLSARKNMLVQLVLKRRVRISPKVARTLSARTVNAIIDARRTFGADLGFGREEDARTLLKGVKNLEKAIMSSLVDVLDLAVRLQPKVTGQLLRSRIIPQAENLDLWTFLRLLAHTTKADQQRLPMGTLTLEAQFGIGLHRKLLDMGRVTNVCAYPKTISVDNLISSTVYQSLTADARAAYTEHIAFMLLDIHPWSQVPVEGTLDLAQELQRIINYHCDNSSGAAKIKFPKVGSAIVGG